MKSRIFLKAVSSFLLISSISVFNQAWAIQPLAISKTCKNVELDPMDEKNHVAEFVQSEFKDLNSPLSQQLDQFMQANAFQREWVQDSFDGIVYPPDADYVQMSSYGRSGFSFSASTYWAYFSVQYPGSGAFWEIVGYAKVSVINQIIMDFESNDDTQEFCRTLQIEEYVTLLQI